MTRYPAYLEVAESGLSMGHILDLPGCYVRATSRDEAIQQLPEAIREYHTWLRRHGRSAPMEQEPIEVEVVGESTAGGPFDPGDVAALFPPEREAIAVEEMEGFFSLMDCSRADLLGLVQDLPDQILDWRPDPKVHTTRRLLRHIGNAEEWYVSRIVSPEALPAEWEHDEALPSLEFLEMARRTGVTCLRQLTEEERSGLFYPSSWTEHPEEPWTARKVLRRFVEHEREHTAQIRAILGLYRRHLLAKLAAARGDLLDQLVSLDQEALMEAPFNEGWTVKDALAHIAAWDRWVLRELRRMAAGEAPDVGAVRDINAYNAANVRAWRDRPLDEVVEELHKARTVWVRWMQDVALEEFYRRRPVGRFDWGFPVWVQVYVEHDGEHAHQLAVWREARPAAGKACPKSVLLPALAGRRADLLAAAALVLPEQRASRPVCGEWTLKDVLGHVADWEAYVVQGLGDMAAGRPPQVENVVDEEAWNQAHAAARREQPWEEVWLDFHSVRQELLQILQGMEQAGLDRAFPGVWDAQTSPYVWGLVALAHDRSHAADVREAMFSAAGAAEESGPKKRYKSRGR